MPDKISRWIKLFLPAVILAVSAGISIAIIKNKPATQRRPARDSAVSIEASRIKRQDYRVIVRTQGTVRPSTESTLISEVAGRIVKISRNFRDGGFFEAGDVLVQIDPRNYHVAVTVAEARLAEARLTLAEEKARARQAQRDWKRLGKGGEPTELVLRKRV